VGCLNPFRLQIGAFEERVRVLAPHAREHLLVSAPLSLRGSTLEHKLDAQVGGLSEMISVPAAQLGIEIQRISAEDVER
jgi:hypothetical protein